MCPTVCAQFEIASPTLCYDIKPHLNTSQVYLYSSHNTNAIKCIAAQNYTVVILDTYRNNASIKSVFPAVTGNHRSKGRKTERKERKEECECFISQSIKIHKRSIPNFTQGILLSSTIKMFDPVSFHDIQLTGSSHVKACVYLVFSMW